MKARFTALSPMGAAVGGKNLEASAIDIPARPCRAEDS